MLRDDVLAFPHDCLDLRVRHLELFCERFKADTVDTSALHYLPVPLCVRPDNPLVNYLAQCCAGYRIGIYHAFSPFHKRKQPADMQAGCGLNDIINHIIHPDIDDINIIPYQPVLVKLSHHKLCKLLTSYTILTISPLLEQRVNRLLRA